MSVAARVELALEIWASLGADRPVNPLSAEDEMELELRDRELDEAPNAGDTWEQIRARIEAGN